MYFRNLCNKVSDPIKNGGTFASCTPDCVGFQGNDLRGKTINLCSIYLAKYTYELNEQENYIGFMFAAIRKNGEWFYNDKAL